MNRHLLRLCHLLLAAGSLALLPGCSVPGAIKSGGDVMKNATTEMGTAYHADLVALRGRLEVADKAIQDHRVALAQARASQAKLGEELAYADAALAVSRAMTRFDEGTVRLLTEGFDRQFADIYLARLRPRLDELEHARATADQASRADPNNAALARGRALALGRFLVTRLQALEDYRIMHLEAATRVQLIRGQFLEALAVAAKDRRAGFPSADEARNYQALFDTPASATPKEYPKLADGLAEKEAVVLAFAKDLDGVNDQINHYLQTNAWRKEMLTSLLTGFTGAAKKTVAGKLGALGKDDSGFLEGKIGRELKAYLPSLQSLLDQYLDKASQNIAGVMETTVRKVEEKVSSKINPDN